MLILAQLPPLVAALICSIVGSVVLIYSTKLPFPHKWGAILFVTWMYVCAIGEVMIYYHNSFGNSMFLYGAILFFSLFPICIFISYRHGDERRKNIWKKAFKRMGAIFLAYLIFAIFVILFIK
ncbi:hypothetical protein RCG17_19860 [Neobacillus sp. PS3-12]|uniref:hypothetical protein n=1 Tax=Neobacillus sp. PS3-12 TaxID=3070677 RepID=UPI0027E0B045|nr:hypothetical protein [Neobacillus sp. PS3-12]WML51672.1 hypothetical protein RCG17_19860 [Neobacillus sp. PS3-12]